MADSDDMDFLLQYLGGDAANNPKAQMAAAAAALRKQKDMGNAGMGYGILTGDVSPEQWSKAQLGQAEKGMEFTERAHERGLSRALMAQRQKELESYREAQLDNQGRRLDQGEDRLGMGKFQRRFNPVTGAAETFDPKSGQVISTEAAPGQPPAPGVPPGAPRQAAPGSKADKATQDALNRLDQSLNSYGGRMAPHVLQDLQNRLLASERIKKIAMDENGNAKDLPANFMTELAAASAALISQGHPAEGTIHQLVPQTRGLGTAKFLDWLSNSPHGTGQKKFVQLMVDQSKREEELINHQLDEGQSSALPGNARAFQLSPDQAWNVVNSRSKGRLKREMFDPNTFQRLPPSSGNPRLDELRRKKAAGALQGAAEQPPPQEAPA